MECSLYLHSEKENSKVEITRKEVLQRMGKYAALTAVGTFLILNPKKAQAQSPFPCDPGNYPFNENCP